MNETITLKQLKKILVHLPELENKSGSAFYVEAVYKSFTLEQTGVSKELYNIISNAIHEVFSGEIFGNKNKCCICGAGPANSYPYYLGHYCLDINAYCDESSAGQLFRCEDPVSEMIAILKMRKNYNRILKERTKEYHELRSFVQNFFTVNGLRKAAATMSREELEAIKPISVDLEKVGKKHQIKIPDFEKTVDPYKAQREKEEILFNNEQFVLNQQTCSICKKKRDSSLPGSTYICVNKIGKFVHSCCEEIIQNYMLITKEDYETSYEKVKELFGNLKLKRIG